MHLRYGIGIGGLTISVYEIARLISAEAFLHPALYWATWLIYLIGLYLLAKSMPTIDEALDRKHILRRLFIAYLIANLIYYLYYYGIVEFIDPEIVELQSAQIQEEVEDWSPSDDMRSRIFGAFLSFAQSAIAGFAIAAALAFNLKKT